MSSSNLLAQSKDSQNKIIGLVAVAARQFGWSANEAGLMGLMTNEAATARILNGQETVKAIEASYSEAELVMLLQAFALALSTADSATSAFRSVIDRKRKQTASLPGSDAAFEKAEKTFADATAAGLDPSAAFAAAYMSAGATMRIHRAVNG
jgi:hypothetical protein